MTATRRRYLVRRLLASSLLAILIGVGVVRAFAGGATAAPPDRAAAFVPRDALVYLNVATNRHSPQWKRALAAMDKLPTLSQLRDALMRTAEGGTLGSLTVKQDVNGWLGNEAAFAQLPGAHGQLLVLRARDPRAAERSLEKVSGSARSETYRDVLLHGLGGSDVAGLKGGFALVGERPAVHAAIDAATTPGSSLGADKTYEELRGGLPHDRLATGYLAQSWIKAHLAGPAALLSGAAHVPAIQSAALSFGAGAKRLELTLRGRPAPGPAAPGCSGGAAASNLLSMAPARPALFIGLTGAECILRELTASPSSGIGAALRSFSARAQQFGVNVGSELFPLLRSESSLSVTPGDSGPTITLDAANVRPQQGIGVLTRLQPALGALLQPESDGATPDLSTNGVDGVNVVTSSLTSGLQLNYAAFNGDLVVSNSVDGVAGARKGQHLAQTADFNTVLGDRPKDASALVFFDLEKLLALADQAGLSSNPTYSAVRDDLQKVGAAGIVLAREGKDIDAELRLKTP